jgi:hypothetical protein
VRDPVGCTSSIAAVKRTRPGRRSWAARTMLGPHTRASAGPASGRFSSPLQAATGWPRHRAALRGRHCRDNPRRNEIIAPSGTQPRSAWPGVRTDRASSRLLIAVAQLDDPVGHGHGLDLVMVLPSSGAGA